MAFKPTVLVDVELAGFGGGWTDISSDVIRRAGISVRHGIQGSGPSDLVASTGVARFALNNSIVNSAKTLGYYSPYHASHRSGWAVDIRCRIRLQDPNTSSAPVQFIGRIDGIDPAPGKLRERVVIVTVVDWMDEAARWTIPPDIGEQVDKRYDEVLAAIVALMPRQPVSTSYDAGVEAYPYALDQANIQGQYALSEFAKLAASEVGLIYVKGDGTLRGEGRHQRLLDTTSDWTIPIDNVQDLRFPSTRGELIKTVKVTEHPKIVDPLPTTLIYDQANAIEIAAGATKFLLGPYRDPITGDPIGATDVQPQVLGTDYVANSMEDGSGTDASASITLVTTIGPNGASFDVTNGAAATVYLTTLRLYGKGIYDRGTVQFQAGTGDTPTVTFDMPYQADDDVGQGAADYFLAKFGSPFAQARSFRKPCLDAATLAIMLTIDISSRITLSETVTGLASSYFVNAVELTIAPAGVLVGTYTLAPAEDPFQGMYWILGTSILGTDTVPAPF